MPHLFEPAATARAKCRGCGERIAAGVLRFGESLPNPFADGETTYWFHLDCAAYKRPQPFLEALEARTEPLAEAEPLRPAARAGLEHHRLPRLDGAERDPSGRAQCRSCHAPLAKGSWRLRLVFWEEGRFSPAGFLRLGCARAYFETTDVLARLRRFSPNLGEAELSEILAGVESDHP